MAGIKLSPEDSDASQPSRVPASTDLVSVVSDDDRSVAADSWSIKSDYGSTMDDDQRHADASEALSSVVLASDDYRFSDLTGIDYSEGAINLAKNLADRNGFTSINFLVDDILETKVERQFQLVMDKGTLDAIGLHPDGPIKRIMYWNSISRLMVPGGILMITSCKSTKDELVHEVDGFNQRRLSPSQEPEILNQDAPRDYPPFKYLSHFQSDSTSV